MQPFSGNQRPDLLTALMNMSLVLRLPRKMHLCRSSSNVRRLPSFFGKCYKTLTFCLLLTRCTIPCLRLPRTTTSERPKVLRNPAVFYTFDFDMCFAPQRRALFRHLSFQKWSAAGVLCTFLLRNVLRATTACTFSTSQLPKVVRTCCVLHILTSKCASRHKACNFSSLIWPAGSAPAALASLLFDPPEPQIIGKTQCFATFLPFRAPGSSFFWLFLFLLLFSSLLFSDSSHLCFSSVHIVGSLTSKLPSSIAIAAHDVTSGAYKKSVRPSARWSVWRKSNKTR